ncbi:MAG: hypothetical protein E7388_06820 [Ruminococcaceae bacterium]|nr:hypothetical protein [Oscillospiraceae bacterium]
MITELGLVAVEAGKKNGKWYAGNEVNVEVFTKKLEDYHQAYENHMKFPPIQKDCLSQKINSFKTEAAKERDFLKIVDMLNKL